MLELTTLTSPIFWVLLIFLIQTAYLRLFVPKPLHAVKRLGLWRFFRSVPMLAAIGILGLGSLAFRLYLNYLVPADMLQDIISAVSYEETGSFYRVNYVDTTEKWLQAHPPARPFAAFPALDRLQSRLTASSDPGALAAQAHPPQMGILTLLLLRVLPGRFLGPLISLLSLVGLTYCTIGSFRFITLRRNEKTTS
jgi:hypothetical protein